MMLTNSTGSLLPRLLHILLLGGSLIEMKQPNEMFCKPDAARVERCVFTPVQTTVSIS